MKLASVSREIIKGQLTLILLLGLTAKRYYAFCAIMRNIFVLLRWRC